MRHYAPFVRMRSSFQLAPVYPLIILTAFSCPLCPRMFASAILPSLPTLRHPEIVIVQGASAHISHNGLPVRVEMKADGQL